MSYANGTTHYNLPQTTGTDKRDWSDANQAFQDIDAALYQATQDTAQAALDIDALEVRMDTAEQNIATNAGDISALDGRVTTVEGTVAQHTTQIADVRRDAEDMICAYNEATATSTHAYAVGDYFIYNDVLYRATASIGIGDTIVPDTNCTTTNVTSELLDLKAKLIYRYKPNTAESFDLIFQRIASHIEAYPSTKKYMLVMDDEFYTTRKIFNHELTDNVGVAFSYVEVGSSSVTIDSIKIGTSNYYRRSTSSGSWAITSKIDETTENEFSLYELT